MTASPLQSSILVINNTSTARRPQERQDWRDSSITYYCSILKRCIAIDRRKCYICVSGFYLKCKSNMALSKIIFYYAPIFSELKMNLWLI
jgi:hypothetical protein